MMPEIFHVGLLHGQKPALGPARFDEPRTQVLEGVGRCRCGVFFVLCLHPSTRTLYGADLCGAQTQTTRLRRGSLLGESSESDAPMPDLA